MIRISSLRFLELQSAFALKVRSGGFDLKSAGIQRARFLLDIAAGDVELYSLTVDHFVSAERLVGRHGFSRQLRTLDALHLAVALDLMQEHLLDKFVVAD